MLKTRPLTVADVPLITKSLVPLLRPKDVEGFTRTWFEGWPKPGDRGVVASEGELIAGACWFRRHRDDAATIPEIVVAVSPDYQRRGWGKRLLAANIAQARDDGLSALHAVIRPTNAHVMRLLKEYDVHLIQDRSPEAHEYLIRLNEDLVVR